MKNLTRILTTGLTTLFTSLFTSCSSDTPQSSAPILPSGYVSSFPISSPVITSSTQGRPLCTPQRIDSPANLRIPVMARDGDSYAILTRTEIQAEQYGIITIP